MRTLGLAALSVVAACRVGFEPLASDAATEPPPDDSPVDAQPVLGCTPTRLTLAGPPKYITAIGTRRGYAVFTVDDAKTVRGYAYEFVMGNLVQVAGTGNALAVPPTIDAVGAIELDDVAGDEAEILLAVKEGDPPTGTALIPLDARLERVDVPVSHDILLAGAGRLTANGNTIAFLGQSCTDDTLHVQAVSRLGAPVGAARPVDTTGRKASQPTMFRAQTGYMAMWTASLSGSPDQIDGAFIDENLDVKPTITIHSDAVRSAFHPAGAYSPAMNKYLFAWAEKISKDFIKLSLRDHQLVDAPGAIDMMQAGAFPSVSAGADDFLVAWAVDAAGPQRLAGARIAQDGGFLLRGVTNTGGASIAAHLAAHSGQSALIWVESGATSTLWFDSLGPRCP